MAPAFLGLAGVVIRAMDLRQRVLFANEANAVQYEAELVDKMFRRAVVTGLNSEAIRSVVRPVLLEDGNTDEEILDALIAADIQEQERQQKQGAGPKRAQVMSVDTTADDVPPAKPERKERPNPLLEEQKQLRGEIAELRVAQATVERPGPARGRQRRPRCQACTEARNDY